MAAEIDTISLESNNQNLTYLEEVKNWFHDHPETAKILQLSAFILGATCLAAIPFAFPSAFTVVGGAIWIGCWSGAVAGLTAGLIGHIITIIDAYLNSKTHPELIS